MNLNPLGGLPLFVCLFLLLASNSEAQISTTTAAPLGINIDSSGSCNIFVSRYKTTSSKPVTSTSETIKSQNPIRSPNIMMYDATNPSDIFPNARAVSITCLDDRIWILHIAAKKVRPSQLDVEIALDGLKQKYKLYSGDTQVNTDVTRSVFAAGNVEIALDAEQKRDFYMIRYTVHKERFGELSDSDRKAVNDDIESIKKQKSAL